MGSMEELVEEYKSPFNFEQGVNISYLYLSPEESFTPPGSPVLPLRGPKSPDIFPEVGEDAVNAVPSSLTEEEQAELHRELAKVEDEIQTLSQVLAAKEKQVAEIKRKLGITLLNEFKQNLSKGWHEVTTSTAYKKTSETLSQVGQKATTAFSSVGSAISRKLEDVSIRSIQHSASMPVMRNTPTFKSFEEKVETIKTKMNPTPSTGDTEEVSESTPDGKPVVEQPAGTCPPDQKPH
ncbi:tumor protein D52-like isoform X2 [Sinocyclocheilus anshuiensis]|uniref:tumor protein D52-like isoform X2 n=1 Tax=Sinocyclocheilus anshuiensis TaxID=1608454 RepID=UPI0007B973FB|nr:PREDICTED: tumor protein D52-like isoform X2 [Sinocyclocheilus anshuiensis]